MPSASVAKGDVLLQLPASFQLLVPAPPVHSKVSPMDTEAGSQQAASKANEKITRAIDLAIRKLDMTID